jgi:hypothetical protein
MKDSEKIELLKVLIELNKGRFLDLRVKREIQKKISELIKTI